MEQFQEQKVQLQQKDDKIKQLEKDNSITEEL